MSEHGPGGAAPALPPPRPWEGEIESHVRAYRSAEGRAEHGTWLVQRLTPAIGAVFRNQGIPSDRTRDLTQETLVRVFEKIGQYRFEAPFGAWVRQITVNLLRNSRRDEVSRRRYLREEPMEVLAETGVSGRTLEHPAVRQEPEAEGHALRSDLRRVLNAALSELPSRMRRSLTLFAHGFTYQEIADTMGVSLNTVRSQISHGYRRLRPLLAPDLGEHPAATAARRGPGDDGD